MHPRVCGTSHSPCLCVVHDDAVGLTKPEKGRREIAPSQRTAYWPPPARRVGEGVGYKCLDDMAHELPQKQLA